MTAVDRRRLASLAIVVAGVAAGCFPAPATEQAHRISDLYRVFFAGGLIVAGVVWGLATWAVLRYRHRDPTLPTQTHGSRRLEVATPAGERRRLRFIRERCRSRGPGRGTRWRP